MSKGIIPENRRQRTDTGAARFHTIPKGRGGKRRTNAEQPKG